MRLTILILRLLLFSTVGLAQDTIQTSDYLRKGDKVFYKDKLFTGIAIERAEKHAYPTAGGKRDEVFRDLCGFNI